MIEKIKNLYKKYREIIQYLIFGVLSTLVNFGVFFLLKFTIGLTEENGVILNTISNIVAIIFAYVTNRIFVFQSKAKGFKNVLIEVFSFFACRALTLVNDIFVFWLGFNVLGFPDVLVKFVGQVIIVVLNYILSKLIVFRKKGKKDDKK